MCDTLIRSVTIAAVLTGAVLQTSCRTLLWRGRDVEAKQIAVLDSGAPLEKKMEACRELARVGTRQSVPALAALLADEKLGHMARFALEPIPSRAVDSALRQAVDQLSGRALVGVIGSIGVRRDAAATPALIKRLGDADAEVAQAAARALGRIGTADAAEALALTLANGPAANQLAVIEGLLRGAEALAAGNARAKVRALAIYDQLRSLTPAPHQVRTAALRGAVLLRQDAGVPLLLDALRGDSLALAEAAARTALELPGAAVVSALAGELPKLPADRQILVASVLGRRGQATELPALAALARNGDTPARVAAIRALSEIGDAAAAPLLLALHRDAEPEVASAARDALAALAGPQVDTALEVMLKSEDAESRVVAVDLLGQRRVTTAVPALLMAAEDVDEAVRVKAVKVLASLAGAAEFPALVGLLLKSPSPASAEALEASLSAVCVREARPTSGRVTIHKAEYGVLPDGGSTDVTAKVTEMVKAGTFAIDATNSNFGDPTPGRVKQLRIEYTVDETTETRLVGENETLTLTAGATPPPLVDALCAALTQANGAPKLALLRVLRTARGAKGLAAVRAATAEADAAVRNEAISVLCGWPTTEALPDVTQLAKTATDARTKILAIRGCLRLAQMQTAPAPVKLASLQATLALCERIDEKRLGLAAVAAVPAPEALTILAPHLANAELKEDASLATIAVAEKLAEAHPKLTADAVDQVLKATGNPDTKKRAEALQERLRKGAPAK